MHSISDYHIGEEINKEMRRQGLKAADFARALNKERQTVYDIFKKRHIATDTLSQICRILNRDFFSELSKVNFNYSDDNYEKEEEEELKESVSGLMPENRMHVFKINYMLQEVVEEYLIGERKKPLVIFCPSNRLQNTINCLPNLTEKVALDLQNKNYENHKCKMIPFEEFLEVSSQVPLVTNIVLKNQSYSRALLYAEKLMQQSGNHVILYIPIFNDLRSGTKGGLIYEDLSEELFQAWKDRVHFVVAGDQLYTTKREYYMAYRNDGVIDRLIESLNANEEMDQQLFNLIFGLKILDVEEIKKEDSTGLSRIRIFYRGIDKLCKKDHKKIFENGINDKPILDMWLDIRNGYIVDFQYNNRTQPH